MPKLNNLVVEGALVGASTDYLANVFSPNCPYSYCRICGEVFQSPAQRINTHDTPMKQLERAKWATTHEETHTPAQKQRVTNNRFTPEAINKLAPFGIIPLFDIVLNDEAKHAALEAPRISYDVKETT